MMATKDLTKMVEEVSEKRLYTHMETQLFLEMAAEIKANREKIEKLKADIENQTDRYDDSIGV